MDTSRIATELDLGLLKSVPLSYAKGNLILPISRTDSELRAAVSGVAGGLALRELARSMDLAPHAIEVPEADLMALINKTYGQLSSAIEVMQSISGEDLTSVATEFERPRDLLELTEEAPIIRLLNALLQQAVKERASDIHVEPYENELEVRMRIDGVMRHVLSPPKIIQDALVSRVKIMANLDIAEKRLPQDGRIRLLVAARDIDIRVSVIPTTHGERVVMRLLDRMQGVLGLEEVGLGPRDIALIEEMIGRSNGIVLVTGPTGSGKTTTLYAALNRILSVEKNIITVEDPVEYQLRGVGQIQVAPKVGLTFASGLRSILRQDPDVIMVGEIRDSETAEIAIQASLTGHLVLSTLHTNDAPSAVARLLDMRIEPFLVASSLTGVIAQRLVRRICQHCKEAYEVTEAEAPYFDTPPELLYRGRGCQGCNQTGYLGRVGLFEILQVGPSITPLITKRSDAGRLREHATQRLGMRTLRADGLEKVRMGETTLEEVLRVTQKGTGGADAFV